MDGLVMPGEKPILRKKGKGGGGTYHRVWREGNSNRGRRVPDWPAQDPSSEKQLGGCRTRQEKKQQQRRREERGRSIVVLMPEALLDEIELKEEKDPQ